MIIEKILMIEIIPFLILFVIGILCLIREDLKNK